MFENLFNHHLYKILSYNTTIAMSLSLVFFQRRRWCGLLSRRLLFCWRMELPVGEQLLLPQIAS